MKRYALILIPILAISKFGAAEEKTKSNYSYVPVNISILPSIPVGVGRHPDRTVSNLAINILGGTRSRLMGLEIGGVANLESEYVAGMQISGVVNASGNSVYGAQIAGVFNGTWTTVTDY